MSLDPPVTPAPSPTAATMPAPPVYTETAEPWTITRVLTWSTSFLRERAATDTPRLDAEILLGHALGLTRIQLYTGFDKPLSPAEREPFKASLKRRVAGEPVAYITGSKDFMGLAFTVSPAALIPRPDTEVLVEAAEAEAKRRGGAPLRILDIGTGTGCIAIALAKRIPGAVVTAWDVCADALALARANAERLDASVTFAQVDALSDAAWATPAEPFDLIVSNPPYIAPAERQTLPASVERFEPAKALFADAAGLAFYGVFAERARALLADGGWLGLEIGSSQADAVSALLKGAGWSTTAVTKDYNKLDRVVVARP